MSFFFHSSLRCSVIIFKQVCHDSLCTMIVLARFRATMRKKRVYCGASIQLFCWPIIIINCSCALFVCAHRVHDNTNSATKSKNYSNGMAFFPPVCLYLTLFMWKTSDVQHIADDCKFSCKLSVAGTKIDTYITCLLESLVELDFGSGVWTIKYVYTRQETKFSDVRKNPQSSPILFQFVHVNKSIIIIRRNGCCGWSTFRFIASI